MALSTCTVSGTLKDLNGSAIANVTVYANLPSPLFYGDGTMIPNYRVSTTTDANGAWSMVLVETTSVSKQIQISFDIPNGSSGLLRKDYYITVPNQTSAQFSTLVSGQ